MIRMMIIAVGAITGMMVFWFVVQYYWKRVFPDQFTDPDVLAGRSSCGNCGCGTTCQRTTEELNS